MIGGALLNNRWNRLVYKAWSPVYDYIFNTSRFLKARNDVFKDSPFTKTDDILVVGVGTGAELNWIKSYGSGIIAVDLSVDMLNRAQKKHDTSTISFYQMDAAALNFEDDTFDYVTASLILSVVPHPENALKEMIRVLKPGGVLIIFDKFNHPSIKYSKIRMILRPLIKLFGTDIGLNFNQLYSHVNNTNIQCDRPIMMNGFYRKIIIRKLK